MNKKILFVILAVGILLIVFGFMLISNELGRGFDDPIHISDFDVIVLIPLIIGLIMTVVGCYIGEKNRSKL